MPLRKKNTQRGFTLIELMVSLSIFTVVVLASAGSVFVINNAAHQVDAMRSVLDNLNFALDSMVRTIHTAEGVSCKKFTDGNDAQNCAFGTPASTFFVNSKIGLPEGDTDSIQYAIKKVNGKGQLVKYVNGGSALALTDPAIDVQKLTIYITGAKTSDKVQPSVTIIIKGVASAGTDSAPFALQTMTTVRRVQQ